MDGLSNQKKTIVRILYPLMNNLSRREALKSIGNWCRHPRRRQPVGRGTRS